MTKNFDYYGLPVSVKLADDTVILMVDGDIITEHHHAEMADFNSLIEFCEAVFTN